MTSYVLTVSCQSTRGIVAAISGYLAEQGCNIVDSSQFDDLDTGKFFMRVSFISEGGVKLKLGSPFAVPPTFTLVILNPNTGISDKRSCETRWQRGDQIGARFVEALPEKVAPVLQAPSLRRPPAVR